MPTRRWFAIPPAPLARHHHGSGVGFRVALLAAGLSFLAFPADAASFYADRPDDPHAVRVEAPSGADDTAVLQGAIDQVQETRGQGLVFVGPGRYRVTSTIHIWPGIRLIGWGAQRPTLVLPARTPGFDNPDREKVVLFFAGGRPGFGRNRARDAEAARRPVPDANPGTFYSAVSNLDVEVEDGNPGAVAVRARYAQHCFVAHLEFRLGTALAGIHEGGNVVEDVRFVGGRYGIWTGKPSPSWQFTVIDSTFEGQRECAILEREAGLTLIRPTFRNVPTAVAIEAGEADELWVKDGRLENIQGPAFVISLATHPRNEINFEGLQCREVPVLAWIRGTERRWTAPGSQYVVRTFSHGLHYASLAAPPEISTRVDASPVNALPPAVPSDLPALPPVADWLNVRSLGAQGDGVSDDTEVIRRAIAGHRVVYLPQGFYVVRDTITLRPDTVLIGLHPGATQLILPDGTRGYQGVGGPKALLETPLGGSNIVVGVGLHTGGANPRAVAARWRAGSASLMNDVRFLGGHGTIKPDGSRENPYNANHTADADPARRWDSQYPSLWVSDGGGGTFLDLWTPSTFAQAGMLVSDTETEGRVYQVSSEHHVRHEVQVRNAAHWRFYALQTEAERGESGFCLPLEISGCRDITIANFHAYRVISSQQPFPYAVKISNSKDLRFRNVHCYSNSKVSYDAALYDQDRDLALRQREFAWLNVSHSDPAPHPTPVSRSSAVARGERVRRLASGFFNLSGGAAGPSGEFYFVDAHWHRIYRWDPKPGRLTTVGDFPLDPVNLAVDTQGNLLVISAAGPGSVFSVSPRGAVEFLAPEPTLPASARRLFIPCSDWRLNRDSLGHPTGWFVAPDRQTAIPVGSDFLAGATSWGIKSSPPIRSFGLAPVAVGQPFYVSDEAALTTWRATAGPDGGLVDFQLFVEQGGEGTAVDSRGNVYVVAGQLYVYSPAGKLIDTVEVPERPLQAVFGGPDRRTLFLPARTALYSVRTRYSGR